MRSGVSLLALAKAAVALIAVGTVGCDDHPEPIGSPNPKGPATSPDAVVVCLVEAWHQRDITLYNNVLDPSFVFTFSAYDVNMHGTRASWDRSAEMAVATRIFSGQNGIYPNSVVSIDVSLSPQDPEWTSDADSTSRVRRYSVDLTARFQSGVVAHVRGTEDFHVTPAEAGALVYWYLSAWEDEGVPTAAPDDILPATELDSWGYLKSYFDL
jgi:hypothetical protein